MDVRNLLAIIFKRKIENKGSHMGHTKKTLKKQNKTKNCIFILGPAPFKKLYFNQTLIAKILLHQPFLLPAAPFFPPPFGGSGSSEWKNPPALLLFFSFFIFESASWVLPSFDIFS
jgi:hypothetical protein